MPDELVNMSSQFKGLPMGDLIGGPLDAACEAQVKLARATADFIRVIGFLPPPAGSTDQQAQGDTRTASFRFKRPVDDPTNPGGIAEEEVELEVPLLAIVNVPSLSIQTVDITFDMEVKSSFSEKSSTDASASLSADMEFGWGLFKAKVNIQGSVATHKENTRSSDNSAKYHVSVHAEDKGMPEGLARVMDILQSSVAPRKVGAPVSVPATP
ncbi:DUF2589 domain-containing protein [Xanthomonas albilineans]|uniref:DUF2589 domain-containing protein n=1 Tax=Xanthomonas albilineans (strain GPE PC73 / CFBP 7063) TaxID=380358 RepID=D2U8I7_XANAP|nr:DUF2589 domain-containing protein [Xanthomonas albilineans]PPU94607.1 DUF2589 domain-containing protein [Xanthomonas albilineans]QHQ28479.1 hypothetical protein XaFJ1_GM001738 [Xanthomonas albilineans]CBA16244.1 hypothetical protein XALC_1748 [Xanthomonas albilineans GPE PC73]